MDIHYTKEHEWVQVEGEIATVGISRHAADELGDITFVELPAKGKTVRQTEVLSAIESVKAASDIYAPLSGTVTEVNAALDQTPELVNESAEEKGWICKMKVTDAGELANLMDADAYREYLKGLS